VKITKISPVTRKVNTLDIPVTLEQIEAWQSGVLIQQAMPNVSKEHREFLKTGVTPEDWKTIFG
jgi:hypothetical protein